MNMPGMLKTLAADKGRHKSLWLSSNSCNVQSLHRVHRENEELDKLLDPQNLSKSMMIYVTEGLNERDH